VIAAATGLPGRPKKGRPPSSPKAQGRPGVWFYSLDANQWLAVKVARALFNLPYEHAKMSATVTSCAAGNGCDVDFRSRRAGEDEESLLRLLRLARMGTDRIFAVQAEAVK
jgi:uncharacterized protein YqjF (DUF2071 family)